MSDVLQQAINEATDCIAKLEAELGQARKERDEAIEEAQTYWALILEFKAVLDAGKGQT